mgnify:CR=1 FL=1
MMKNTAILAALALAAGTALAADKDDAMVKLAGFPAFEVHE